MVAVTLNDDTKLEDFVASLRTKLRVPEGVPVRAPRDATSVVAVRVWARAQCQLFLHTGDLAGCEVVDITDIQPFDELRVEAASAPAAARPAAGGAGGPARELPAKSDAESLAWLSRFVSNPEVQADIQSWKDNVPEIPGDAPDSEDKLAGVITAVMPTLLVRVRRRAACVPPLSRSRVFVLAVRARGAPLRRAASHRTARR